MITLPGDNAETVLWETKKFLGQWPFQMIGVENGSKMEFEDLRDSDPVSRGRMEARNANLGEVLCRQPRDGNLVHLDADLCGTWKTAPIESIISLFGGVFDPNGGSMTVTVKPHRDTMNRPNSWRIGFALARRIRNEGFHCLCVPVYYPNDFGRAFKAHGGRGMARFGYAWFKAKRNPSVVLGNTASSYAGCSQMKRGEVLSNLSFRGRQDLRQYFRRRMLPNVL